MSISIITVTCNSEKHLEQTVKSVTRQSYPDKQYIIIDGASQDKTLDIIRNHEDQIDFWISEPDKGIADAMNKGLKAVRGDYILFLHSDDYLVDENVLKKSSRFLDREHEIFLYNLYYSEKGKMALAAPRGLNWWINFKTGVLHQACICSRTLFEKIGNFDTNLKIAMDYDFFLRAYRAGVKVKHIDIPLTVMRKAGISSRLDWQSLKQRFAEERQIHNKNCQNIFMKLLYQIYWSAYLPYRYLLHHFG